MFRPENLQNLQANKIQALILRLKYLIPTGNAPTEPVPQREPAHRYLIIQDEKEHPTPPKPTDAAFNEWRQLTEGRKLGPPPPLIPNATAPPQGPAEAQPQARQGSPSTIEEVGDAQQGSRALASYLRIFDLLEIDMIPEAKY